MRVVDSFCLRGARARGAQQRKGGPSIAPCAGIEQLLNFGSAIFVRGP